MQTIATVEELEAIYGDPVSLAVDKVALRMTPMYRRWIEASRFLVLVTVGPEGTDGTPRGDDGPVVRIIDDRTVWLPDWRGNNRIDSLRNIVRDPRVSLMFMVPGCNNVVRINGKAVLSADPEITGTFEQNGKHPRSVMIFTLDEMYFQCAKALMRSGLWVRGDESAAVPTAGDFLTEYRENFGKKEAKEYDDGYPVYAAERMW
ncbi:MAG: pyridoxamine 5'-phosphate oxidase family protein [Pseudomonadota bacterium]